MSLDLAIGEMTRPILLSLWFFTQLKLEYPRLRKVNSESNLEAWSYVSA
jgi:hypothetical protein